MLMICTDESSIAAMSPEEGQAMMGEYGVFSEEMAARGVLQGGERLHPTTDATSIQVGGKVLTVDGPFAETKEQIGGYLVDCRDRRGARGGRQDPRGTPWDDRGPADLGDVNRP